MTADTQSQTNQPQHAPTTISDALDTRTANATRAWRAWLSHNPQPASHSLKMHIHTGELDNELTALVVDTGSTHCLELRGCSHDEVTYLTRRAQQLGLRIQVSSFDNTDKSTKDVVLHKPRGWSLPAEALLAPTHTPRSQPRDRASKHTRERAVHDAYLNWRRTCCRCGQIVNAYQALYSLQVLAGPYCQVCLWQDDNLNACTWTPFCKNWTPRVSDR